MGRDRGCTNGNRGDGDPGTGGGFVTLRVTLDVVGGVGPCVGVQLQLKVRGLGREVGGRRGAWTINPAEPLFILLNDYRDGHLVLDSCWSKNFRKCDSFRKLSHSESLMRVFGLE